MMTADEFESGSLPSHHLILAGIKVATFRGRAQTQTTPYVRREVRPLSLEPKRQAPNGSTRQGCPDRSRRHDECRRTGWRGRASAGQPMGEGPDGRGRQTEKVDPDQWRRWRHIVRFWGRPLPKADRRRNLPIPFVEGRIWIHRTACVPPLVRALVRQDERPFPLSRTRPKKTPLGEDVCARGRRKELWAAGRGVPIQGTISPHSSEWA